MRHVADALPAELLQQAQHLLALDPFTQANLRRSISTAYYSLFALLVHEAAKLMVGSGEKKEQECLYGYVIRAFSHKGMLDVCRGFAQRNPGKKIIELLAGRTIPDDLASIAGTFRYLQEERHEADYNFVKNYTKDHAAVVFEEAKTAHQKWQAIKDDKVAEVFLVALLVQQNLRTSG